MTSEQAWRWVETHECILESYERTMWIRYMGRSWRSGNVDSGMRIIECVAQATEATS